MLVEMAMERDKAEWARTASVMATLININRPADKPPVDPRQLSPYTCKSADTGTTKIKLTRANLHLLKPLVGKP